MPEELALCLVAAVAAALSFAITATALFRKIDDLKRDLDREHLERLSDVNDAIMHLFPGWIQSEYIREAPDLIPSQYAIAVLLEAAKAKRAKMHVEDMENVYSRFEERFPGAGDIR